MKYNLWDVEIGRYLGQFRREDAAIAAINDLATRFGQDYVECLSLGRERDDGVILTPLPGSQLVSRGAITNTAVRALMEDHGEE